MAARPRRCRTVRRCGERNQLDIFRSPLDTPHKIDNWYVVGATSGRPEVLTRGTADPSDDIQVLDGEAWVTVTSASEGTSRVTAYTPEVSNWQFRQASATIYWVDAQWIFPPSAAAETGRPHVLTTAVMRRTDGAPLAGWIVRYEVGGGGSLGYEGGRSVDVPVDANGRASVEVSPADATGGSATVAIAIVRPQTAPPNASPRLEIGRSCATITWGAAAAPPIAPGPAIVAPSASGIPGLPPPPNAPIETAPTPAPPGAGSRSGTAAFVTEHTISARPLFCPSERTATGPTSARRHASPHQSGNGRCRRFR